MIDPALMHMLIAVACGGAVALIVIGLASVAAGGEIRQRMQTYSSLTYVPIEQRELQTPFRERVLRPLLSRVLGLFAWSLPQRRIAELHHRLHLAGIAGRVTTADFIGIKGWTALILGLAAALYLWQTGSFRTPLGLALALVLVVIGFRLPDIWLSRQIKQRQLELTHALPDALDMLTIAVEAGLSFEQALGEIVLRWKHDLAREFRRVLYEIGIGKSRREALEQLSWRTGVPDVLAFVTAVNHAEELGTSLAQVLTVQAQELRIRRRQRAQEAANKVPIKMLFPMVFLIFPAMFAVILGPGVPRLFQALGVVIGR